MKIGLIDFIRRDRVACFSWAFLLLALIFCGSCGKGGCTTSGPPSGKKLSWRSPQRFSDGAAIDPARDLVSYEIYINETGTYSSSDALLSTIPAVDLSTGNPVTSFDLSGVNPPLKTGGTYFLTMRAVDRKGGRSDFALPPVRFIYR